MLQAVEAGAFTQSAFSRISPGEYIQAGRRGSRRLGDIAEVPGLSVRVLRPSRKPLLRLPDVCCQGYAITGMFVLVLD
jgi:hypothetical protein